MYSPELREGVGSRHSAVHSNAAIVKARRARLVCGARRCRVLVVCVRAEDGVGALCVCRVRVGVWHGCE